MGLRWIDLHSKRAYRIGTGTPSGMRARIRVKTYRDVIDEFRFHAEAKSADSKGNSTKEQGAGLLQRLRIRAIAPMHLGKETNLLEEEEEGTRLEDPQAVYWADPGDWEALRWWLSRVPLRRLAEVSGITLRALKAYRCGERAPGTEVRRRIFGALARIPEA